MWSNDLHMPDDIHISRQVVHYHVWVSFKNKKLVARPGHLPYCAKGTCFQYTLLL